MEGSMSAASTVIGTPYYMSPEVCQNQPYNYKSDVWALGCILYEMCALQQAWNGSNLLGLVYKIVQEKYPPLSEYYSADLRALVADMLAKDPALRPNLGQILRLPFIRARMQSFIDQVAAPQQPSPSPQPPPGQPAAATAAPPPSKLPQRQASSRSAAGPSAGPSGAPAPAASARPQSSATPGARATSAAQSRAAAPPQGRGVHAPRAAAGSPNTSTAALQRPTTTSGAPSPACASRRAGSAASRAPAAPPGAGGAGSSGGPSPPTASEAAIPRSRSPQRDQWRPEAEAAAREHAAAYGGGPPSASRGVHALERGPSAGRGVHASASVEGGGSENGLTPKEQMRLRKQREADRRSVELSQAVAQSDGGDVARRLTQMQFQSSLSDDYTPSNRPPPPASSSRQGSFSGYGSASEGAVARGASPPAYGQNYGDEYVRESLNATASYGDTLTRGGGYLHPEERPAAAAARAGVPAGTVSTLMGTMQHETGVYENDFEDYTMGQNTARLAGLDVEHRNGAADAQRARLRELAKQQMAAPERGSQGDADIIPAPVVPREAPLQALKQRCTDALGDDFQAVYQYLKRARQQNEADGAVRRNLLQIVGHQRLNDCMWVDQLIFKEDMQSKPASPRR